MNIKYIYYIFIYILILIYESGSQQIITFTTLQA